MYYIFSENDTISMETHRLSELGICFGDRTLRRTIDDKVVEIGDYGRRKLRVRLIIDCFDK